METSCVQKPIFKKTPTDRNHFIALRSRVLKRIADLPKERTGRARLVAFLVVAGYFILYGVAIFSANDILLFAAYQLMGILLVLIFLNLIHESVHQNVSASRRLNNIFIYLFDLMGANSFIWRIRHIQLHHGFPNVAGWDADIEQASFMRIFPHDTFKTIHRNQHRYFIILYPFYLVNWVLIRDFKDFLFKGSVVRKVCEIPAIEWIKLILFKSAYFCYLVMIPIWLGFSPSYVIVAAMSMLITGGSFALLVLLTPHVNVTNQFPVADKEGCLKESWLIHQLATTNDVHTSNWFTRNLMGNFNYHIAHHLFPGIPQVFAPEVTEVIKEYAMEHGLPYRSYSLFRALQYHFELLRINSLGLQVLNEEL